MAKLEFLNVLHFGFLQFHGRALIHECPTFWIPTILAVFVFHIQLGIQPDFGFAFHGHLLTTQFLGVANFFVKIMSQLFLFVL